MIKITDISKDSEEDLLQFLLKEYSISLEDVLKKRKQMENKKIIEQHIETYSPIWQGKNGRWYTYLPKTDGGRRQIAKCSLERVHEEILKHYKSMKSHSAASSKDLTLRLLYPIWFKEKWLDNGNSNTMKHIDLEWRTHYLNDPIIDVPIDSFTKQMLKTWAREKILSKNLTKKQYYNMQIIIRQSLDYLVENDKLTENPFRGFTINKKLFRSEEVKSSDKEVFSIEEEKLLKEEAWKDFYSNPKRTSSLAVIINFSLGLRVGELVALKWKDLSDSYLFIRRMEQKQYTQLPDGTWKQHIEVVEHTKTERGYRKIYVIKNALAIFELIRQRNLENGYDCSDEAYIFQYNFERISANSIDWYYEKYCNKLHITKKGNHKARKTCLTKIADNPNINLKDAMEFAGHADVKTFVKHYCFSRYSDDYKRNELEKTLTD